MPAPELESLESQHESVRSEALVQRTVGVPDAR